ncbi:MAG: tetratricopeptide repeat protein [Desulfobacterales bacterium]|nr:tetratricopeptide repeat protein [Desulfobacterales bacterium]
MNNEYDSAIEDYSRAIEINPKFVEAYYSRGFTYLDKGMMLFLKKSLKNWSPYSKWIPALSALIPSISDRI